MLILNCNVLLYLSLYFKNSFAFHTFDLFRLISGSDTNHLEDIEKRQTIMKDSLTYTEILTMPLDHFNLRDNRFWFMKYFNNYKYFKAGGPIILQIGGEAPNSGEIADFTEQLARETGGALFSNQHRYYGLSFLGFPSLDYLSSRQSLADLAYLLRYLKGKRWLKMSKVVVVGGSYPGNLAAWMRLLYPDLVDAAHASSAPLLAKTDFFEYTQHVSDVLKTYCDPEDFEGIKQRFEYYNKLLETKAGIKKFQKEVNVCANNDLRQLINVHSVFLQLVSPFVWQVQSGHPQNLTGYCKVMNHDINNPKTSITLNGHCKQSFIDMAKFLKKLPTRSKHWTYQTCTEFGFFQTLSSKDQIFTQNLPVDFQYALCREVFGPEFGKERAERGVEETNKLYGGLNRNLTRVVFVNGGLDPWSRLSVLEDLSPEAPARVIPGVNHCKDLDPANENRDVSEVQEFSKKMIKKWIGLE